MKKDQIVSRIAHNANISKKDAEKAYRAVITSVAEVLSEGKRINIQGFGTFQVGQRKARKGRNPQTGKEIKIKAKKVAKFVPGKALKDAVR